MLKSYRMIKEYAKASFIEKKSEFISHVMPVNSEEEAIQFINSIRKKYYDATHNCYAYILGENSMIQRSSDDGEPSGTAGVPILEVIRKEELTNTAVVVTRYFGGIMLGAGGLIRAYTEAAVIGLKAAKKIIIKPFEVYNVSLDYTYLGRLQHEIPKKTYTIFDTQYSDKVTMTILTEPVSKDEFIKDISEWTNGTAFINHKGEEMMRIDE